MPNTAPGAERVVGGVTEDAPPVPAARRGHAWRPWAGAGIFLLLMLVLAYAYLRLSQTYAENSDEANILLMANDMLHGNLFLSGWHVSDVPFITTELPQMAVLVGVFGLHLNTAHIAAAVTYTLAVAVAMLLAKGRARGGKAIARMAVALGIMLAPQPGVGIFVAIFSVGHIGTAVPVMLAWLVLDWAITGRGGGESPLAGRRGWRRWWLPAVIAVMLAWAEMADPLVLVLAIFPMLAVCLARVLTGVVTGARDGDAGRLAGMRAGLAGRWLELSLAAAAGAGYAIALLGRRALSSAGGYVQHPVPYQFDAASKWFMQARIVVHGLLEIFGAYFVPGRHPQAGAPTPPAPSMLDQVIAYSHLIGVVLALWGACAIARRFFFRDADFVSQLLLAGIIANIFAYIPSTLADHSALNTREVAPVLPLAAVLAARMLGDRLLRAPLGGPLARFTVRGRRLGVRVVSASLVVVLGWYGFGLWRQAETPPAPVPLTGLVSYLEGKGLSYGIGGYWESSLITVESGGNVTVRAVTPACMQPYQWESKSSWYDPSAHSANFVLLDNVPGYFSKFSPAAAALLLLKKWYGGAQFDDTGSHHMVRGYPLYQYEARVYSANLLATMPRLRSTMPHPPAWLVKELTSKGNRVPRGKAACK
ncbi:MAG: hypothetical protein J2P25_14635 [Nocardiopsaceae bacterium]|nr:hypothetical protein [Nocardiopsaceae bacterium]